MAERIGDNGWRISSRKRNGVGVSSRMSRFIIIDRADQGTVKGRGVHRPQPPQGCAGNGLLTPDNAERILNGIEHNGGSGRGLLS